MEVRGGSGVTTRRRARDPYTRTVVRLPERELSESLLHLAAPLLEALGPSPAPDEARRALELAINLWNGYVMASPYWGGPEPKLLAAVRKAMCGKQAPRGLADTFELLTARWRAEFSLDPRLVGDWSFEAGDSGRHNLVCETKLPDGVEAHVPPPIEKRVAIGGQFLDETQIRLSATSFLGFPVESHRGEVGGDGVVKIRSKMPAVVALFAQGRLSAVGGAPVEVMVGGKNLGPMVLVEVSCAENGGHHDVAMLVFRSATAELIA